MSSTLQVFDTARWFIQAIEHAQAMVDNAPMNLVIGAAHDLDASQKSGQKNIWMIVHGESPASNETIKVSHDPAFTGQSSIWMTICSHNLETYYITMPEKNAVILSKASQIIESVIHTLTAAGVPPIHSAFGPKVLVDLLLDRWSALVDPSLAIREKAFLTTRLAYLTPSECEVTRPGQKKSEQNDKYGVMDITSLPYAMHSPEMKAIQIQLVQCVLAFWGSLSEEGTPAAGSMITQVLDAGAAGRLWICLPKGDDDPSKPTVAGYLYTGRQTKNIICIRNVYTKDAHRGQGVAQQLVAAASRWWLQDANEEKKKQAVVLFVEPENVAATRAYQRSGFRIEEEIWERRGFDGVSMGVF